MISCLDKFQVLSIVKGQNFLGVNGGQSVAWKRMSLIKILVIICFDQPQVLSVKGTVVNSGCILDDGVFF